MMWRRIFFVAVIGSLPGCGYKGPSLQGFDGLGYQVSSFYGSYAIEQGGSCTAPEMSITGSNVVEDTPEQLVLSVKYYWRDPSNAVEDPFTGARRSFGVGSCTGFSERQFTISKITGGGTQVVAMTGDRRDR